jgi:transposase-like protein
MNLQNEIKKLDARISRSGFSIAQVCRRADIQQSSYTRWRKFADDETQGTEPRVSSLAKLEAALNQLIASALE